MQRYKITLVREVDGSWNVAGYWEVPTIHNKREYEWSLDGAWRRFNTRKEAEAFISTVTGVPE